MSYVLAKKEDVQELYPFAETLPDGRLILPISAVKMLSDIEIELVSKDTLLKLKSQPIENVNEGPVEDPQVNNDAASDITGEGDINTEENEG